MTKTEQELLSELNAIDTEALAKGGSKLGDLFTLEKTAMWKKGVLVLKKYPELEGGGAKAGRPKKNQMIVSMNKVAIITGRSTPTISNWIKLVMVAGKTKKEFDIWVKGAKVAAIEKWQQKLIENKKVKEQKETENKLYLSLREQVDIDGYEDEHCRADIKMLFGYFKQFENFIRRAIMQITDGENDKARIELEKALNKLEE